MEVDMKIKIITERVFDNDDFWPWVRSIQDAGVPMTDSDAVSLLTRGSISFITNLPHTIAKTTYILEK